MNINFSFNIFVCGIYIDYKFFILMIISFYLVELKYLFLLYVFFRLLFNEWRRCFFSDIIILNFLRIFIVEYLREI